MNTAHTRRFGAATPLVVATGLALACLGQGCTQLPSQHDSLEHVEVRAQAAPEPGALATVPSDDR